jgi:hypothetical protein
MHSVLIVEAVHGRDVGVIEGGDQDRLLRYEALKLLNQVGSQLR